LVPPRAPRWRLVVLAWLACLWPLAVRALPADTLSGEGRFALHTRWGQVIEGRFPEARGHVEVLADGRHRVHIRIDARQIQLPGHPRYTTITRGPGFFDAATHPWIEFVSEPYTEDVVTNGGIVPGELSIRGRGRPIRFLLAPLECDAAGRCLSVAVGEVSRAVYGMDRWRMLLEDRVGFELRMRTQGRP
jgi:polyisoprenoid-binding protein YceI